MRARVVLLLLLASGCQSAPKAPPSTTPAPLLHKEPLLPWGDSPAELTEKLKITTAAVEAGSRQSALAQLHALEAAAKTSSDVSERLSRLYDRLGYLDRSYQLAQQAVALAPQSASALLRLARVEQDTGYTPQAREHYKAAIAAQPDAIEPYLAVVPLFELEMQLPEGEKALRTALARDPTDPAILGLLARNLVLQERFADARLALDAAEKEAPNVPPALLERGNIAFQEAKREPAKAESHLTKSLDYLQACLKAAPENTEALSLLGQVALEKGDTRLARTAWERAYALQPDLPALRVHLGRLLVRLGETARGAALQEEARRAMVHHEQLQRLAGRVSSAPDDLLRHREFARWAGQNQESARGLLEWAHVLRLAPTDTEAKAETARLTSLRLRSESGSGRG